jgi:UDPglucose 6-dehydrogenase
LATKVSFANEMKQICDKLDIDYDKVIEYATKDKRLGMSHWAVPGPMPANDGSGKLLPGYSGSCFVKDINALIHLAKELGIDPKVMNGSWLKNLEVRPGKDWMFLVGRAIK